MRSVAVRSCRDTARRLYTAPPRGARSSRGDPDTMADSGALAEWLGSGLQSRLQRFESARRLYSGGTEPNAPAQIPSAYGCCVGIPTTADLRNRKGRTVPDRLLR